MNKRFLSTLLFGALFIASTSMFVSCKDYDDDIKNLQTQIDKAALKSQLDALQTTLDNAKANAESSMKNLEAKLNAQAEANAANAANADELQKQIDAVKAAADAAAKDLAAKIEAAAKAAADAQAAADKAQQSADQVAKEAAELARAAQEAAEQAVKEAVAKLNEQNAELQKQIENLGRQMTEYVKADELAKQIEELKREIALRDNVGDEADFYKAAIEELYQAITSIEIIDSFTGYDFVNGGTTYYWDGVNIIPYYSWAEAQGKDAAYFAWAGRFHFPLTHGFVPETSEFGDNELLYYDIEGKPELVEPFVKYFEGDDVKDPTYGLIVRVNPVNVDLTTCDIMLINSLGESLADYVTVGTPQRYGTLYTRSPKYIDNGLWILPFEVSKGIDENAFKMETTIGGYISGDYETYNPPYDGYDHTLPIVYAVAVNNTQTNDEDRYVISSYDVSFDYNPYVPANHFTFYVSNESGAERSVEYIHNRYQGIPAYSGYAHPIYGDNTNVFWGDNYELEWQASRPGITVPTAVPVLGGPTQNVQENNNLWSGDPVYMNDIRRGYQCFAVGFNEAFTIHDIAAYTEAGDNVAIDSIYVVLDKKNAVESEPSEINAWEGYQHNNGIEGLNQHASAAKGITMKVTDPRAKGDVIGFRVFAVNRDGTLVDPDGRAFYILVTDKATDDQIGANVTATIQGNTDTSNKMETAGMWKSNMYYEIAVATTNPKIIIGDTDGDGLPEAIPAVLDYFHFNWDGVTPNPWTIWTGSQYTGNVDYVGYNVLHGGLNALTITPTNIENLIDGATYTFYLTAYEYISGTRVDRNVTTITLTKVMPDQAKKLTFRPKQETEDGSGNVIAYMIPNKYYTYAYPYAINETFAWWPGCQDFATQNWEGISYRAGMEIAYDARGTKATNGFKNLTNIFYNLSQNGQNGRDKDANVYDEDEWDKTFEFIFGTSLRNAANNADIDLVDATGKGVAWEHPGNSYNGAYYSELEKYMLDVATPYIDGQTQHAVSYGTDYQGISSTMKDAMTVDHFNQDYYKARTDHPLTFTYACWHHASDGTWKWTGKQPELQWKHEGNNTQYAELKTIVGKNSYDPDFFGNGSSTGMTLRGLLIDKHFLELTDRIMLVYNYGKADAQINPYFVPTIDETKADKEIVFIQTKTQTEAAPTADHTETLLITCKDAFDHDVVLALPVTIKRP
jgi:hypothetical protein